MSLLRMRSDIKPLCDIHRRSMALVFIDWQVDRDVWTKVAFACGERGCERHYDITHGYYTIHDSQIQRDTKLRVPCSREESPMFLYEYEPQGSIAKWMCGQFGCKGGKETGGPFK